METGFAILVIVLISSVLVGAYFLMTRKKKNVKTDAKGMLNIVYDEYDENPQMALVLYDQVESVIDQEQVLFDVNVIRQNSRK